MKPFLKTVSGIFLFMIISIIPVFAQNRFNHSVHLCFPSP